VRVRDRLEAVFGATEGANVLHRAGTVQRHERRQVIDRVGLELLDGATHTGRFELEGAEGLARTQHLESLGVPVVEIFEVDVDAVALVDQLDGALEDRQVR
jgi:hypothetical protein